MAEEIDTVVEDIVSKNEKELELNNGISEEVEVSVIEENIVFMEQFSKTVKKRGSKMPKDAKMKLKKFKEEWNQFFDI